MRRSSPPGRSYRWRRSPTTGTSRARPRSKPPARPSAGQRLDGDTRVVLTLAQLQEMLRNRVKLAGGK